MIRLRRFIKHNGGVSAVEFAFVAPILFLVLGGVVTGWTYSAQLMEMRTAVKTGANYVLQGGVDLAATKSTVIMSWSNKPGDAVVQVIRECSCAGVVSVCTSVCAGNGSIPNMSVIITASGSVDMPLYKLFATSKIQTQRKETIRVR